MGGKSEKSQTSPRIYRDHVMCHFCSLHRNCRSKKCKNTFFLHFGAKHRASAVFSLALHTLQPLTLSCHFWFSIHTKYNMLISQLLLLPLNTTGKMFHSYRNQKSAFSKMPNSVFSEDVKERRWMIIKSLKFSISRCSAKWIYYICLLQGWACHRQIIYPLTPPPHPLIRSNSRCVNQVQSLNSSRCLKKLYICSSSESGECPRANPSCSPPKMTHSVSDTVFMGRGYKRDMGCRYPLLMLGLLFLGGRFVPRDHVLSFRVQEEYKRF